MGCMISRQLKTLIESLPQTPGVYIYRNSDSEVIYVGKSIRLRDRVKSYFVLKGHLLPKTRELVKYVSDIEIIKTDSELEALLLESMLIKKYKPYYNSQWKDDKGYKYIKIGNAGYRKRRGIERTVRAGLWPYLTTSHRDDDKDAIFFGPFPEGTTITQVLKFLRRIYPWCKYQSLTQRNRTKKPCFYKQINLCPGICSDQISLSDYWREFDQLIDFLAGKKIQLLKKYRRQMQASVRELDFESAAYYRDIIYKLEYTIQQFRNPRDYVENPNLADDVRLAELMQLAEIVGIDQEKVTQKFRIEGYDISNLGKDNTVASGVVFIGGEARKSDYRRYRIRQSKLPNDFAAIGEVISRRLKSDTPLPDLFLIDGGKGQLASALNQMHQKGKNVPMIGLAKRFETVVLYQKHEYIEIKLPETSPALNLLKRIRDESHRFAQSYHKLLRRKA